MVNYATKLAEAFSSKVLKHIYETAPIEQLVNRDYDSTVGSNSKINILSIGKVSEHDYDGSDVTPDTLQETNSVLHIDVKKVFNIAVKTIDTWKSYIKNPKGTVLEQKAEERKKNIMTYLLGFYSDVASGNWYGTDYTTGTVTVTTGTGAVTGSGTTFTAAMVGRPFRATGHTKWYRVKTYSSSTSITIEDDIDDETSAYTGGAISGGTAYTIQAATVKTIDNSTTKFLDMVLDLKQKLDEQEVPENDRCLFIPPVGETYMLKDSSIKLNVPAAFSKMVEQGLLTELAGFKVFRSNRVAGDNTNGFFVLATHKAWLTYGDAQLESKMLDDIPNNFGSQFKDLFVYGAKVADERRKFAAVAFVKFA